MSDEKIVPGTIKRILMHAEFMTKATKALIKKGKDEGKYYPMSSNHYAATLDEANIVTSVIDNEGSKVKKEVLEKLNDKWNLVVLEAEEWPNPETVMHAPVIDLDIPHTYVPSTTPGHGHLYLDVPMDHENFMLFLEMLADFGIIEKGYYTASKKRGYSAVRLPWKPKLEHEA